VTSDPKLYFLCIIGLFIVKILDIDIITHDDYIIDLLQFVMIFFMESCCNLYLGMLFAKKLNLKKNNIYFH